MTGEMFSTKIHFCPEILLYLLNAISKQILAGAIHNSFALLPSRIQFNLDSIFGILHLFLAFCSFSMRLIIKIFYFKLFPS